MKVKTEKAAKRCEICHQNDCFNEKINYCSRCSEAKSALVDIVNTETNRDPFDRNEIIQRIESPIHSRNSITVIDRPLFTYDLEMPLKGARIGVIAAILINTVIIITHFHSLSYTPTNVYSNYAYYDLGQYIFSVALICVFISMFIGFIFGFKK